MIEVKQANSKKDIKTFALFQPTLYTDAENYVPPLLGDEIKMFTPGKSPHIGPDATVQCFLAYKDGKVVGRVAGVIQHQYNKKNNKKRLRFIRLDFIDDEAVAHALLKAVEDWGKSQGMTEIHGPLDFNDLGREGLLIEGFDYLSTFEMQYNHPYYQKHIESYGYKKEVDWIETRLKIPDKVDERNHRLAGIVQKRTGLKLVEGLSKRQIIKRYGNKVLDCLDEAYAKLYGVVPLSARVREDLIKQFNMSLNKDYIAILVDKDDNVAGFGLALPSISKAVQKSKGKLLPFGFIRVLHALKHNDTVDLCLICVRERYVDSGATSIIFNYMLQKFIENGIKVAESNAQLEDNYKIQTLLKNKAEYEAKDVRRRRCYVKELKNEEN